MFLEIGFVFKDFNKEKISKKIEEIADIIRDSSDFKLNSYIQKDIPTITGDKSSTIIKNIEFDKILSKNEEADLLHFYKERKKYRRSNFFKRFESFEEFKKLSEHYYLPIMVNPLGKIEYMKSFYSTSWINNFKDNFSGKYGDCYLVSYLFDIEECERVYMTNDISMSYKDFEKIPIIESGHDIGVTYHTNIKNEFETYNNKSSEDTNTEIKTYHAENFSSSIDSLIDLLKVSPMDDYNKLSDIERFKMDFQINGCEIINSKKVILKQINEKIILMIHIKNGAWGYVNKYYFITESGKVYEYDNKSVKIDLTTINSINKEMSNLECLYKYTLNNKILTEINGILPNIIYDKDEKGKLIGSGFDMGEIKYFAINENISKKPIIIRLRGNYNIDSIYKPNNDLSEILKKIIK